MSFLSRVVRAGVAAAVLVSASAQALSQPDGAPIPADGKLKGYLSNESEPIEPSTQAAITPVTFDPSCQLTFTVISRGGSQKNSFGWYNVTGNRPAPSELYEFIGCNDGVGTKKVLSIRNDPRYKGGKIGFFMATTEKKPGNCVAFGGGGPDPSTLGYLYFSERQYNDDNIGASSYIHLIIMDSQRFPKAFYFGWEDLYGGGDNDFEDLLTRVEGITCVGGGGACTTSQKGICAAGTLQCRSGVLACVSHAKPRTEACNGLDDDCDGKVDDDAPCPVGQLCEKGRCVDRCGGELFTCKSGEVCAGQGLCVEEACAAVSCPEGQRCFGGSCRAPCTGVTCPLGQVCRVGACVEPCAGVTCDAEQVCQDGVCRDKCACSPCQNAQTCQADGRCVANACANKSCGAGTVCGPTGACVDACTNAVCPTGQGCDAGRCADLPPPDAGQVHPPNPDGGPTPPPSDAGASPDGGSSALPPGHDAQLGSGCGCASAPALTGLLWAVGLWALRRRRARPRAL